MIEVADQGVAEPPAGVGRVRLGREHIKADAGQVPGIQAGDGGVGVEEGAAGNVTSQAPGRMARSTVSSTSGGWPG